MCVDGIDVCVDGGRVVVEGDGWMDGCMHAGWNVCVWNVSSSVVSSLPPRAHMSHLPVFLQNNTTKQESDEAGVSSSKGPLLGSMGSSLKTALFHSFKVRTC